MKLQKLQQLRADFGGYAKTLAVISIINLAAVLIAWSAAIGGQVWIGIIIAWIVADAGTIFALVKIVRPLQANRDEWKRHAQEALETTKGLRTDLDAAVEEADNWRAAYERERTV